MKIFTLIGIFTNTSIVFYDLDFLSGKYKWPLMFGIENLMIFMFFIVSYKYLPLWFNYIDQIRYSYVINMFKDKSEDEKQENNILKIKKKMI